jgi:hypothetical protein
VFEVPACVFDDVALPNGEDELLAPPVLMHSVEQAGEPGVCSEEQDISVEEMRSETNGSVLTMRPFGDEPDQLFSDDTEWSRPVWGSSNCKTA